MFQQALTDPGVELSPEVLAGLGPEELALYNRNRHLDQKLREGLSELAVRVDAQAPSQENFLKELANRLDHADQEAAKTESSFFLKMQLRSFYARMRELMVYSPGAIYRWAPALLLLIAAGLAPILVERDANGDAGDNLSMSGTAGNIMGETSTDPGNLGASGPGELPDGQALDKVADQVEAEMKLLADLAMAEEDKDKAAKKKALQALEKHYQSTSEKQKLQKIQARLKSL